MTMQDTHWHHHTSMCTTTVMQLSPCYGCMDLSDPRGKGFEMLEYRQGEQEMHLRPADPSMDHGNFQHCNIVMVPGCLDNSASFKASCLQNSLQPRVTALSRNYICHSFLCHQGLTSLKCQQRPATGLILGADGLR